MIKSVWLKRALAAGLALGLSLPVFAQTTQAKTLKKQPQPVRLAQAETVTKPAQAPSPKQLETVTVVGSRIARKDVEGPSPVTIITGQQIKDEGFTTLYEVMNDTTQSFPVQTPPSWGSTNVNARQFNMYGLGPNHTLLLIDGMRVADYPQPQQCCYGAQDTFQNYNNIPAGMVDRVEILDSGGSAIYGSDAIAGVVNVVLKHHYNGDDIVARGGASTRGGRDLSDFEWFGGKGGDTWSVIYNFQAMQRSPLWGYQRPYTDADSDAGYGTWNSTDRTYGYQSYPGAELSGQNGYITPPAGACTAFGNEFRLQNSPSGYYCAQNALFEHWVLTPGRKDLNGYVRGEVDLPHGMEAYAALGMWHTVGTSNTELPFLYQSGSYGGPIPGLPASSGNPYPDPTGPFYDQTTGQVITGYLRQLTAAEMGTDGNTYDTELDWDFKVGLKGKLFDRFAWDLTWGRNLYWVHENYTALDETAMFNFFFGPNLGPTTVAGTTYNTYALNAARFWGPITPAEYSTFAQYGENRDTSWIDQGQGTITGTLFNDWAGPVGFAAVANAAEQGFVELPDALGLTTSFQNPFQEYNTGGGRRTHGALGMEFRVPLLKSLTATLAGRSDRYNEEGPALKANTFGTGLEWRPIHSLLVRGSYNTSFHAPDMIDIYPQTSVQAVGIYNDPLECIEAKDFNCPATQHNTYFNVYSGANPALQPEKGKSFTYGVAWDPGSAQGFMGSIDYVHIVLNNEIEVLTYSQILTDEAGCLTGLQLSGAPYTAHVPGSAYCNEVIAAVTRDPSGQITSITAGAINEATTKISAINAQAGYRWIWGNWGNFNFHVNYTLNVSFQQQVVATDPLTNMAYQNPKSKMNASLTWDRGPWEATLWGQRIGGVEQPGFYSCANAQGTFGPPPCAAGTTLFLGASKPWTTMNISTAYNITARFKVNAYVSNVFNRVGDIPYYAGGFEFIQTNADQDYVGREWSLELDYKLD
jgi:outer membrane receptor protein involved in Fe transport